MKQKLTDSPFSNEEIEKIIRKYKSDKFTQFVYSHIIGKKHVDRTIKIILSVLFITGITSLIFKLVTLGSITTSLFFILIFLFAIVRLIALIRNNTRIIKIAKILKCSTREVEMYLQLYS